LALSDQRDIIVIADEAHRSQYDFIDGFARHMRDALPQAAKLELCEAELPNCRPNLRGRAHGRGPRKHAIRAG
jgi:type I restriction enzyme, R subunit